MVTLLKRLPSESVYVKQKAGKGRHISVPHWRRIGQYKSDGEAINAIAALERCSLDRALQLLRSLAYRIPEAELRSPLAPEAVDVTGR